MIGQRLSVSLLVGLLLWAPPLGAQDSWVVDRAALGRLSKSFEQGPVVGRLVKRKPDHYVFIPDSTELPKKLQVLTPVEIPDSLDGARFRLWGTYDATGEGLLVQKYEWARSLDLGPQLAIAQTPSVGAGAPAIAGKGFEQPSAATGGIFGTIDDTRFGGQPKLGIVADTFQGNSGSPVFDRDNHCIAGILTGGPPDLAERLEASWLFHQSVLPMPAILADLAQHPKTVALLLDGLFTIR